MMKLFIIGEVGVNHNGDINIAKKLIDMAKQHKCDAVKFQKRTIDKVYTKEFLDSPRESPWGNTQRDQKQALEFGKQEYDEIDRYCKETGMEWFASAWDPESQVFLKQYNLNHNKVSSAMLTNLSFIDIVAREGKHTFISTGMSTLVDIDNAVNIFRIQGCPFTLMHCVSTYPTPKKDLNLLCIKTLQERYNCDVGYSGHEISPLVSAIAVALGATAIERHITLDRTMYGSDQAASLEERGLQIMVDFSQDIPVILGDGVKRVTKGEMEMAKKLRYFNS